MASTTSSASAVLLDATDQNANHMVNGANHPTPSRRHRSSSSLSTRSVNTAGTTATTATGVTATSGSTVGTTGGVAGSTVSGIAPARDNSAPYSYVRDPLSRRSSVASRRSEAPSPSLSSPVHQGDHFPILSSHRHTGSSSQAQPTSSSQQTVNPGSTRSSYIPSTQRYEEAAHHRSELEIVKGENETLRRRIRELERNLSIRRQSGSGLALSESVSTNASVPPPARLQERNRAAEDEEDAVKVGESAGSLGVGAGH